MRKTMIIFIALILFSAYDFVSYGDIEYGIKYELRDGVSETAYRTITPEVLAEDYKLNPEYGWEWYHDDVTIIKDTVEVEKVWGETPYLQTQWVQKYRFIYPKCRFLESYIRGIDIFDLGNEQYFMVNRCVICSTDLYIDEEEESEEDFYLDVDEELLWGLKNIDNTYGLEVTKKYWRKDSDRINFGIRDNAPEFENVRAYYLYFFNIDPSSLEAIEKLIASFRYAHYLEGPIESNHLAFREVDMLQQFEEIKKGLSKRELLSIS